MLVFQASRAEYRRVWRCEFLGGCSGEGLCVLCVSSTRRSFASWRIGDFAILLELVSGLNIKINRGRVKVEISKRAHLVEVVHCQALLTLPLADGPGLRLSRSKATVEAAQSLFEERRHGWLHATRRWGLSVAGVQRGKGNLFFSRDKHEELRQSTQQSPRAWHRK